MCSSADSMKKQSKNRRLHEILSKFLSFGAKFNQKISDSIIVATKNSWYLFFPTKEIATSQRVEVKKSV